MPHGCAGPNHLSQSAADSSSLFNQTDTSSTQQTAVFASLTREPQGSSNSSSNGTGSRTSKWNMVQGAQSSSQSAASSNGHAASSSGGWSGSKIQSPATSPAEMQRLQAEVKELQAALETATAERQAAEQRAAAAEASTAQATSAMASVQATAHGLAAQYSALSAEIEAYRARQDGGGGALSSGESSGLGGSGVGQWGRGALGPGTGSAGEQLAKQVEDLSTQLEDLDYRLSWALRDLRAHQLVLRAQGELAVHLSGFPPDMQQQVFDQVDHGAELLGDGGSADVYAVVLGGQTYAVKVMNLYDINTARPYHFRDICTTFLRHQRSPYIELPLHTFLRLKDHPTEGTQYFLYTVWPRRHMDVDQLLCRRALAPLEVLTIMLHTVLALQDLSLARMVHADVKPPNVLVMLGEDGLVQTAHLTDFGSVQFVSAGSEAAPAIWDGALAWNWPPEQRELVFLEHCDVWGLGLLYSCMTVCNPTREEVTNQLQDMTLSERDFERVRDRELLPDRWTDPAELRALTLLMRRCVVRDPHKRPSIRDLAITIHQLREQLTQRGRQPVGASYKQQ
ncbi:hypothetical protein QJQ45_029264 [Haematococcus lacustris]|nr:hypothetical protein QJQ45_018867 [Haematococcus lacustris]KAJ9513023.1 hypothetical protein QJQ45_029264 [Haematococcus lacustris]